MPITALVILVALLAAAGGARAPRRRARSGWQWFVLWCAAGFLSAIATVSFAIGLLVLPLAVIAIVAASRVAPWPEGLGFGAGIGTAAMLVGSLAAGESQAWLAAGAALVVACSGAYGAYDRRRLGSR